MSKINYKKVSSDSTLYPDNPKYMFPKGISGVDEKVNYWFKKIKEEFEDFEHHKNSSIFSVYGHTSENPTLKMPAGGVPYSERYNNMQEDVLNACRYRIENYLSEQVGGWKVFEKLLGDYEVEIIDNQVMEERLVILNKFTDLLNSDELLTSIDPNTNENAKTPIDPLTEKEKGIEYLFPYGIENTDELHYSVLELPQAEREEVKEEQIDNFIRKIILERVIETERPASAKILGFILGNYPELRPFASNIKEKLTEAVLKVNNSYPLIKDESDIPLSEVLENDEYGVLKEIYLKAMEVELKNYEDIGKMKEVRNSGTYQEVFKTVSVKKLINRCKDEAVKNQLMKFKPPASGKGGGSSWPKSRGGKYVLRFSQNPVDMLTKTTGRAWGSKDYSCENWDGQWLRGPQSDFQYGNCIVWVFNAGKLEHNQQIGRAILRWGDCYDELGNNLNRKDVGLEQQLYPKDAAWGLNMFKAIAQILSDSGYFKYHQLNTPYRFDGYSDYIGRGGCSIQYNKPKFKGKSVELGENELMSMASNVKLAYATAGWLVSNGNEMVKRTLSQNPVIWLYETPTRRLINSSLDLEDGRGLIYDLISSDYADFNFMNVVIDTISLYDPDYDKWGNPENFTSVILNHPNADIQTHQKLLDTHPGFTELGNDIKLGSIEELIYFDVLNRANRIDTYLNRSISLAPMEVLDNAIDKLYSGKLLSDPETIENRWAYGVNYNYLEGDYSNAEDKKFYKRYRESLYAINNLILSPNLSNKSFCKLLKLFKDIDLLKKELIDSGDMGSESLSCRLIESVRVKIAIVSCFPFNTPKSWGWDWDDYVDNNGFDREFKLNLMPLKNNVRYFKQSRQSPQSIDYLVSICPEIFKLPSKMFNFDSSGNPSLLSNKDIIFFNHIQYPEVADYLYKKHVRYGIDPINLLAKTIPQELQILQGDLIDELDSIGVYLESGGKLECMLSIKNQSKVIKEYIDSLDPSMKIDYENSPIKLELLPEDQIFTKNYIFIRRERNEAPSGFIKAILEHKQAEKLIIQFGVDLIGRWLEDEKDFYKFERILYKAIFGKYYEYKGRTHNFTPLPSQPDIDSEDLKDVYEVMMKIEEMKAEIDISLLTICANGLENKTKGLASNPNLPESLQLRLLLPEKDLKTGKPIGAFGDTKWSIISERYEGDYNYYKTSIVEQLASNEGATGPTLKYILQNYYEILGKKILKKIAKNPNSWEVGDENYQLLIDNYPIPLLNNTEQGIDKLRDLFWNKIIDLVRKTVKQDPQEIFSMKICDLGGNKEKYGLGQLIGFVLNSNINDRNNDALILDKIESIISGKKDIGDYLQMWKGGTWNKPMHKGKADIENTFPFSNVRDSPRSNQIRGSYDRTTRDQGFSYKGSAYGADWPYINLKSLTKLENHFEDPQFIISFEDGCFTYLPETKYKVNYKSNLFNDMQLTDGLIWDSTIGDSKQWDSISELKDALVDYSKKYTIPEVVGLNQIYESREKAEDWLKSNYGTNPDTEKTYYIDKITRLSDTSRFINIFDNLDNYDEDKNASKKGGTPAITKVVTNSGPIKDSIITVYEVQEVIESDIKQPSELSLLLERRFGIDAIENLDLLPSSDINNYKYIGRKKNVGGRWVNFSLDSVEFYNEIGYTVDGWVKDLVLGFVSKKRDEKIPNWRLEMNSSKLKTMFRNYIRNPLTDHSDFMLSKSFISNIKKTSSQIAKTGTKRHLTSPLGDYNFTLKDLLSVIDRHKLWTRDIINDCFKQLVKPGSNVFINNYLNAKPTANILKLTLADTEEKLDELGLVGVITNRDVKFIQEWIVNNFANDLPISYIYELISYPGASEQVKALVRNIRNTRLDEFIDYQRQLQDEMLEGGAEEYASEDYNSNYEIMVKKYCDLKYPKDLNKRRALMENIIYGKKHIPIRELQRIIGGE
tara:strand:- start:485 stop:6229 length:5745 start_codon:yes stop_codon:yes gene_type:complete